MDAKSAFRWQWLLRNVAGGLQAAPGKDWLKEGRKRLAEIGDERFQTTLDEWFTFPREEIQLSAAGSVMLRLLVWYGALVDVERSLPVLVRLAHVRWNKRAPVGKVIGALAWILHHRGNSKFEAEARLICARWAGESAEVGRLQELYFPDESQVRRQVDREDREESKGLRDQVEAALRALRESSPQMYGPDGAVTRFREKIAERLKSRS